MQSHSILIVFVNRKTNKQRWPHFSSVCAFDNINFLPGSHLMNPTPFQNTQEAGRCKVNKMFISCRSIYGAEPLLAPLSKTMSVV